MNIPASEKLSVLAGHTDHGRLFESRLVVSLGICAAHHFSVGSRPPFAIRIFVHVVVYTILFSESVVFNH